ncbi:MAG: hypothetical protein HQK51_06905 [Oligoflexia bacterium]|nr:hypothetical protein [Oligoflexia bacterium]
MIFEYLIISTESTDEDEKFDENFAIDESKMIEDIKNLLLSCDSSDEAKKRALAVHNWAKNRIKEYWFSRMALLKLLKRLFKNKSDKSNVISSHLPLNFCDLNIENNRNLLKFKNLLTSITHTYGMVVSGLADENEDNILAFGLDIEKIDRRFSENTKRMFKNNFDEKKIDLIKLWICKEAAFKALDPIIKSILCESKATFSSSFNSFNLKNIWIKTNSFSCYHFGIFVSDSFDKNTSPLGIIEISLIRKINIRYFLAKAILTKAISLKSIQDKISVLN